jgi:hypothetical protein
MSAVDDSEHLVTLHRRSHSLGFRPTTGRTIGLVVNLSLLVIIAYLVYWSYKRHRFNREQQKQIIGLEDSWRNIKVYSGFHPRRDVFLTSIRLYYSNF